MSSKPCYLCEDVQRPINSGVPGEGKELLEVISPPGSQGRSILQPWLRPDGHLPTPSWDGHHMCALSLVPARALWLPLTSLSSPVPLKILSCWPGSCGAALPQSSLPPTQWAAITPSPMRSEPQPWGGGTPFPVVLPWLLSLSLREPSRVLFISLHLLSFHSLIPSV